MLAKVGGVWMATLAHSAVVEARGGFHTLPHGYDYGRFEPRYDSDAYYYYNDAASDTDNGRGFAYSSAFSYGASYSSSSSYSYSSSYSSLPGDGQTKSYTYHAGSSYASVDTPDSPPKETSYSYVYGASYDSTKEKPYAAASYTVYVPVAGQATSTYESTQNIADPILDADLSLLSLLSLEQEVEQGGEKAVDDADEAAMRWSYLQFYVWFIFAAVFFSALSLYLFRVKKQRKAQPEGSEGLLITPGPTLNV